MNKLQTLYFAAASGLMATVATMPAHAAVDAAVTAAITEGTADGKAVAGALLVMAILIGIVVFIKRKASS